MHTYALYICKFVLDSRLLTLYKKKKNEQEMEGFIRFSFLNFEFF